MDVCRIFFSVSALAENLSEGERDAARVDTCRRYLIDKRRKLVEVVLVDQHYLHARPVEVFCKAQSAESATNDYYSFLLISLDIDAHKIGLKMVILNSSTKLQYFY